MKSDFHANLPLNWFITLNLNYILEKVYIDHSTELVQPTYTGVIII